MPSDRERLKKLLKARRISNMLLRLTERGWLVLSSALLLVLVDEISASPIDEEYLSTLATPILVLVGGFLLGYIGMWYWLSILRRRIRKLVSSGARTS